MKAIVVREHGPIANLVYDPLFPDPEPDDDDVLIRVRATSLNYHDLFTLHGMPGVKLKLPVIPGIDLSGEIIEMGRNVRDWKVGDRVLVDPFNRDEGRLVGETQHGGLAEYCRVRAHQLIQLPENMSFAEAACIPVAYGTAYRMIYRRAAVTKGEKMLLLGASGGVGVAALQMAKLCGAEVIACAGSDAKCVKLERMGADHTINYVSQDFLEEVRRIFGKPRWNGQGGGADVVVNYTGADTWVKSLRCLRKGGRLVTCGATAGFDPKEDLRYIWTYELNILGSNGWEREDILQVLASVNAGNLKIPIDRAFPLTDTQNAFQALEDRQVFGKVVVQQL